MTTSVSALCEKGKMKTRLSFCTFQSALSTPAGFIQPIITGFLMTISADGLNYGARQNKSCYFVYVKMNINAQSSFATIQTDPRLYISLLSYN